MKKILLSLSILLSCLSFSIEASFAQNQLETKITKSEKQNLIDDWVDYKLIEYQMDAYLNQQKTPAAVLNDPNTEAYAEHIQQDFKQYTQQYKNSYQQMKPRTAEMRTIIEFELRYLDLTSELMFNPKYDESKQSPNPERQVLVKQYEALVEQITEMKSKMELRVLNYQKSLR